METLKNANKNYYPLNCFSCHAPNGKGSVMDDELTQRKLDTETFKQFVTNGTARMPRFQVQKPL